MKFLVLWHLEPGQGSRKLIKAVAETPNYAKKLQADGKLECRHHLTGKHGGAWIYNVKSNEELDLLLAMSPVYNDAHYAVLPLADMSDPATVIGKKAG
ncbi:MAG TPA: muconolactone Delta-isomerase family protein [Bryobacteraceae bacterium]|nr:muconolactone Delta-isomerase family protein [Bryobacteraceae bacterium]